jgi:release factor glutamine methyltransferase
MNIQQALQQASQALSETSPSAKLDAQVLLTHILQCNTAHLAAWPEKNLSEEQAAQYLQLTQPRKDGQPVAHVNSGHWRLPSTTVR